MTAAARFRLPTCFRTRACSIASRLGAAVLGGYALASAAMVAFGWLAPDPWRARVVMSFSLASFAVYTGGAVWAFAARTAGRAWAGLLVPAAGLLALGAAWRWANGPAAAAVNAWAGVPA